MTRFTVEIEMGHEAMLTVEHLAEALEAVTGRLRGIGDWVLHGIEIGERLFDARGEIQDENGRTVGEWRIA